MSNLANVIVALINTPPGDRSRDLHKMFIDAVNETEFNIDSAKEALDQANLLGNLNVPIISAISACIKKNTTKSDAMSEVEAYIRGDQKIAAIKKYREIFGAGLADSKAAVEKYGLEIGAYKLDRHGYHVLQSR